MQAVSKAPYGGTRGECLQYSSLAANSDHRTFFNDPNEVRQWVANSATGSNPCDEITSYDTSGLIHGDISSTMDGSCFPENVSSSHSMFPYVSLPASSVPGISGPSMDFNVCTTSAGMCSSTMTTFPSFLHRSYAGDDMKSLRSGLPNEEWPTDCNQVYPTPLIEEIMCGDEKVLQDAMPLGHFYENSGVQSCWPIVTSSVGTEGPPPLTMDPLNPLYWPSSLAMAAETSVSSSYSHGSDMMQHPSPPESSSTQEDGWPIEHPSMDTGSHFPSEYSLCERVHVSPPINQIDDMDRTRSVQGATATCISDTYDSTIRASRRFQRAPVSYSGPWSDCEPNPSWMPSLNPGSAYLQHYERETSTARIHRFYQAVPKEDGLYHCPYTGTEGCSHQAEKLKCNYE